MYNTINFPKNTKVEYLLENGFNDNCLDWFFSVKNGRLEILFQTVFNTNKIEFSKNHLQTLFYYLRDNVAVRDKTEREKDEARQQIPELFRGKHSFDDYLYMEPTVSLVLDIAIYFGEYIIIEVPNAYWTFLDIDDRIGNMRPIIMRKGKTVECNPIWLLRILLKQIDNNRESEDRLVDLFETWKNNLLGKPKDYLALINSWSK